MDDAEGDLRYGSNSGYSFNRSKKFPAYPPHPSFPLPSHYNRNDYVDDEEMEEENDNDPEENGVNYYSPAVYSNNFSQNDGGSGFESVPKRQKLKNSAPGNNSNSSSGNTNNYEFVPRNPSSSREDWSEHEKYVLLEVWGDRFLQSGRHSLRGEEWVEVAEKVSESVKMDRSEAQCRLMMDGLKRRYRKEKAKSGGGSSYNGKWAFFKKMDMLMRPEFGSGGGGGRGRLACGVDSGEFVFMDTNVYLERANGNDEMMDSPCESEDDDDEEEEENGEGLRVLADSVLKFGEIYEKIEGCRREQMVELGKMRVDFERELELQKKQILERAEEEIAKIREADEGDDEEEEEEEDEDSDDE